MPLNKETKPKVIGTQLCDQVFFFNINNSETDMFDQ